jgi:hypothetical protein
MKFQQGDFVIVNPKVFVGERPSAHQRTGVVIAAYDGRFPKISVMLNTGRVLKHLLTGKARLSRHQDQPF